MVAEKQDTSTSEYESSIHLDFDVVLVVEEPRTRNRTGLAEKELSEQILESAARVRSQFRRDGWSERIEAGEVDAVVRSILQTFLSRVLEVWVDVVDPAH